MTTESETIDTAAPEPTPDNPTTESTVLFRKPSGPPRGNQNARKHGLRGRQLSRAERYITNSSTTFQRETEDAVIARHGSVGLYHAAVTQSAVRHEIRAQLIGRWLRTAEESGEKLSLIDRANLLKQLSDASDARDKCLERLRLDSPPELLPHQLIGDGRNGNPLLVLPENGRPSPLSLTAALIDPNKTTDEVTLPQFATGTESTSPKGADDDDDSHSPDRN